MKEKVSVDLKIIELQDQSDPKYMTMNVHILNDQPNYNKALFTDDFIEGVVANKSDYVGLPFLVDREALENGETLTHKLKDGELHTDQIGSFVDFWQEEVDGAQTLVGEIRILKRFPAVCETIIDLFENGALLTSCEVMVSEFKEVSSDGVRTIHYNEGNNAFIGSAIVTNPAMPEAKATLLVAEAYEKDVAADSGLSASSIHVDTNSITSKVWTNNQSTSVEINADSIRINGNQYGLPKPLRVNNPKVLINEIELDKLHQLIRRELYKLDGDGYEYYIASIRTKSLIFEEYDYHEGNHGLYHAKYEVESAEDDAVIIKIEDRDKWIEVYETYMPAVLGNINKELLDEDLRESIRSLQVETSELKKEMELMGKEGKDTALTLEEATKTIGELEAKIEAHEATIVKLKEAEEGFETTISELKESAEELKEYKVKYEQAELEKAQAELTTRFEKLFDEETFKSDKVQTLINECDEAGLNSLFVEMSAKADKTTSTKAIEINAQEDELSDRDYLFSSVK